MQNASSEAVAKAQAEIEEKEAKVCRHNGFFGRPSLALSHGLAGGLGRPSFQFA